MKYTLCLISAVLTLAHAAVSEVIYEAVSVGNTEEQVIDRLGKPVGKITAEGADIWYFERGTVEFRDGIVVRESVISKTEAKKIKAQRKKNEQSRRKADEERRLKRIEEGTVKKELFLAGPAYSNMLPWEIVAYWDQFKASYPEVTIDQDAYASAKQQLLAEELARQETQLAKEAGLPPKPVVSARKKRKMRRAGAWIWD